MAISIFNKSKPAYRHLRNVGLIPVPSESRLRQIQAANKVNGGESHGQLIADEMNLTCGILWNSIWYDIWGFVDEELSLDRIIANIVSEEREDKVIAKKVTRGCFVPGRRNLLFVNFGTTTVV